MGKVSLLWFAAALILGLHPPASAQDRYQQMLEQVEKVRGHRFSREVPWVFQDRQQVRDQIRQEVADTGTADDDERGLTLFLQTLGMAPEGFDLREAIVGLYGESIAGRYDSDKKQFYVVSSGSNPTDQFTMEDVYAVHELTHALQDQVFGLEPMHDRIREASMDSTLGVKSLIEGEAELVALASVLVQSGMSLDDLPRRRKQMKGSHDLPAEGIPLLLRRYLAFPYEEGVGLVEAVRQAGGWPLVDQMWKDPPQTSEQVLHPERYLGTRDFPTHIALNLPESVGDYSRVSQDTGGEFMVRCFLEQHLGAKAAAQEAEGWGGDLVQVYAAPQKAMVVWFINWDSPGDALSFVKAARKALAGIPGSRVENLGRANTVLLAGGTPEIHKSLLGLLDRVTVEKKETQVLVKRSGAGVDPKKATGSKPPSGPPYAVGLDGFTSHVHGFTVPLPDEWGIDRSNLTPMLPLVLVRATGRVRALFHVVKLPRDIAAEPPAAKEIARQLETELGPTLGAFQVTETRSMAVGPERFLEFLAKGYETKYSVFRGEVLGRTYTILLAADGASYSKARAELVACLQKMKFQEP